MSALGPIGATTPDTGAFTTLTTSGNVGIGTTSPAAQLDVNGAVRIGTSALTCAAGTAGAVRYNAGALEYCNGTSWVETTAPGTLCGMRYVYCSFTSVITYDYANGIFTATNTPCKGVTLTTVACNANYIGATACPTGYTSVGQRIGVGYFLISCSKN